MPPTRVSSVEESTIDTLGRIGLPAVPALVELLASSDPQLRRYAAQALARVGPEAQEAVPALVGALDDSDELVRQLAIRALGQVGPPAGAAVPKLLDLLQSGEQPATDAGDR
jgi:HEAT repeat protein